MKAERLEKMMMVLSVMGALLSGYLLYTVLTHDYSFCPTTGCSIVDSSEYSYFLGLPIAFWGLGFYSMLAFILFLISNNENRGLFQKIFGWLLAVGVLFTLYLRYLELFVIHAFCIWCWGSVAIVAGLVICYLLYRRKN